MSYCPECSKCNLRPTCAKSKENGYGSGCIDFARMYPYHVVHSCCDGAGDSGSFESLDAAKEYVDTEQARINAKGNPYGYRFTVYGPGGRRVYETRAI
jgi:hypothetical protein